MPFTASHPAVILPLLLKNRKWISATGLLAGSMAPDFEYFFRMQMKSEISHSWLGLLLFNLPIGILLTYLYHNIVRDPLIKNLPHFLQSRWMRFTNWSWNKHFNKNWKAILLSLLLGSLTHLIWDGFTHYYGQFVQAFPFLRSDLGQFPVYRLLQHLSTILGGLVVMVFILKMPKDKKHLKPIQWRYWLALFLIMLIVFSAKGLASNGYSIDYFTNIIAAVIASGLVGLLFAPTFIRSS